MKYATARQILCATFSFSIALMAVDAAAQTRKPIDPEKARVVEHWTKERRAAAIPRDLVIDERGLGYLRRPDKTLVPYGHDIAAQERPRAATPSPFAKPDGAVSGDTTPPAIDQMDPGSGATIGASHTFNATVTDASGVKSVTFRVQKSGGLTQSFSATQGANSVWSVQLSGFTDGSWSWWADAKDNAPRGGNSGSSETVNFTVATGGGGTPGGSGDTITNGTWSGGKVQQAAGRIYFEMPTNRKATRWSGYVCSGTVATDSTSARSVIITAGHCVYDDVNKAFARNVMFIPNQAEGGPTDRICSNDPMGCWIASFGVVDVNWTTRKFPDNIAWDYAYYVVKDDGTSHEGTGTEVVLDIAAGSMTVSFDGVSINDGTAGKASPDFTHALGYSYNEDPKFKYCAEDMTTEGTVNWWLPSCGLSGGSSGGPWVQKLNTNSTSLDFGDGPIISVNSWGYTTSPGMAGPKLFETSASCVFEKAKGALFNSVPTSDGNAGIVQTCP